MKKYNCKMAIGVNHTVDSRIKVLGHEVSDLKVIVKNLVDMHPFIIKGGQVFIENAMVSNGLVNAAQIQAANYPAGINVTII
ncbi:hypothetical protein FOT80_27730 [Serratia fonticola]|nr:hypothetical protein [Serratia fonticola]